MHPNIDDAYNERTDAVSVGEVSGAHTIPCSIGVFAVKLFK